MKEPFVREQIPAVTAVVTMSNMGRQHYSFLVLTALWSAMLFVSGRQFNILSGLAVFALVLLFSLPILLSGLYLVSVAKIHNLAGFAAQGWLYRLLSGRVLATVRWTLFAVVSSFFMLLQFRTYGVTEWLGFFALIPLFYLCYRIFLRSVHAELKPYRQVATALQLARWVTPVVALLVQAGIVFFSGGKVELATLGAAIALVQPPAPEPGSSMLVHELSHWLAYYEGARLFLASELAAQGPWWSFLVGIAGSYLLFFSATSMLACFLIPPAELRRVFAPLSDADQPPPLEFGRVVLTSALSVLVVVFILLPAFVGLEAQARQHATASAALRAQVDQVALRIDEHYYRPQLVDKLHALQTRLEQQLDGLDATLAASRGRGFAMMAANVEFFLDWYYTLPAEYLRTLKLLGGQLEDYLGSQLKEHLLQGAPFAEYEQQLATALAAQQALKQQFDSERTQLLEQYRLPTAEAIHATRIIDLKMADLPRFPEEAIPFALRAGSSAGAGAISAVVVGKVVAKLYAKGALKLAAKPLAKMAAGRAATAAGGAAAGAVIGTVVPGPGTLLGSAIGGAIGLGIGVLTDFGLLKLEEQLGRDELRQQIVQAIEEVKRD